MPLRGGGKGEIYMNYQKALEYAKNKHKGQYRIGGEEYITHPAAVAEMLKKQGYGIEYQITGLFHDLLEDTDAKESEIKELSSGEVLDAVKLLTKQKGYVMAEYIDGIKKNKIAFAVKAADRLHNLQSAFCTDDNFKRKYIAETKEWYMDFSEEIRDAAERLENSMKK